jgi:hypothetical protein
MKIKTKVAFSGVPAGTTGTAELDKDGPNPTYKITWDLPNKLQPLIDWFEQDEFNLFLEVL